MLDFEKRDRRLQQMLDNGESLCPTNVEIRLYNIGVFWKEIKEDSCFLNEAVMVVKNKFGENMVNGLATVYILIQHHKEVPSHILSTLLSNIFTIYIDGDNTKKIFETEITIMARRYSYLTYILLTNDLIIDDEYQKIIAEYLITKKDHNFIDDVGFFLRRNDVKNKYKEQVLKEISQNTLRETYEEWYSGVVNCLIHEFNLSGGELYSLSGYIGNTEHQDKELNEITQLNLKFIKLLEDYMQE